jgi:HSP20 family protein
MKLTRSQRRNLGQWPPFGQLTQLRDEINRFFESPLPMRTGLESTSPMFEGWSPSIDLFEDKDTVTVKAEVPGMKKEDIDVSLEGRMLSICGERREEKSEGKGTTHRSERYYGKFYRSVELPSAVDQGKIKANYRDGVLTITMPKAEDAKRKQIDVEVS